jgi:hypothetical protein
VIRTLTTTQITTTVTVSYAYDALDRRTRFNTPGARYDHPGLERVVSE